MCLNYIKTVSLFIGLFVGAGFGTGAEIMLYFRNSGYISIILTSVLIGAIAFLFAKSDKYLAANKYLNNLSNVAVFFCSVVNFIAMVSACETITFNEFGMYGIGIVISLVICLLAVREINFIKIFNSLIVPAIIVFMIILASKTGLMLEIKAIEINIALYATMNMVLGGHVMRREGKQYNDKQLFSVCVLITLVAGVLLSICYCISLQAKDFVMPIYEMARREGLSTIAWLIILFAILTTQISSGNVIADVTNKLFNKVFSAFFLVLLTLNCASSDFGFIIAKLYPITGWIGVLYTLGCILVMILEQFKRIKRHRLYYT